MLGVALLDQDPDLAAGLTPAETERAAALVQTRSVRMPAGPWDPDPMWERIPSATAGVVLEGILAREVVLGDRPCRVLIGPGDAILPLRSPGALLPAPVRWTVLQPARMALLERQWSEAAARWPMLAHNFLLRIAEQGERLAVHQAISQLPRVEDRLIALFLHLSERWGRITRDGVLLQLDLTHDEIGRLLGARRPTVSLALAELHRSGLIARHDDGGWTIAHEAIPAAAQLEADSGRRRRPLTRVEIAAAVAPAVAPGSNGAAISPLVGALTVRLARARRHYAAQRAAFAETRTRSMEYRRSSAEIRRRAVALRQSRDA